MTKIHFTLLCALVLSSCQINFFASSESLSTDLKAFNFDCEEAIKGKKTGAQWLELAKEAKRLSSRVHGPFGRYLIGTDRLAEQSEYKAFEKNCSIVMDRYNRHNNDPINYDGVGAISPAPSPSKSLQRTAPQRKTVRAVSNKANSAGKTASRNDSQGTTRKQSRRKQKTENKRSDNSDYTLEDYFRQMR